MAFYPKVKAKSLKLPSSRICRQNRDAAFSLEADCKSALKWSSLFGLRISNPQERLAGLRFLLSPGGFAFPPANYVFEG